MVVHSPEFAVTASIDKGELTAGKRVRLSREVGSVAVGRVRIQHLPAPSSGRLPQHEIIHVLPEVDTATGRQGVAQTVGFHELLLGSARLELLSEQPIPGLELYSAAMPASTSVEATFLPEPSQVRNQLLPDPLFEVTG